ncbi:MAG: TonB-dependent receptor, partial [Candidatus Marinimicrobia bacterium]|nr:TonB-dependent receptor [Candidatus Neomarinimicrobiota bacterium]
MMREKFFITTIAILLPVMLFGASTGKVTGVVKDTETGSPLPGANIMLEGTIYGTATDMNGVYMILNIPPGTYDLSARMIGYKKMVVKNVRVSVDLTTRQDFILDTEVLQGEEVIVEATRPLIKQDVTASRTIQSGEEINAMPVDNYEGAMTTVAGAVVEDGTVHFRGGRTSEIVYLLDNMSMSDPLSGNNDTEVSNFAIEETHIMTGGFSAEYGNAQSGVINVITKDGGSSFDGRIRYFTSDNSFSRSFSRQLTDGEVEENRQRVEFILSGPDPILSRLLPIPGQINYLFTGDFTDTDGRFLNEHREEYSVFGKISYRPIPQFTIKVSGLQNLSNFDDFANLWKRTVYEDKQVKYAFRDDDDNGTNDNNNYIEGWYDNGALNTEDINHNGYLDYVDVNGDGEWNAGEPTEDLNGNNVLDREDLNHNNSVDEFNMMDHLADIEWLSNKFSVSISHQLSERTFYELTFHRYYTKNWHNSAEIINEDIDGDGKLDMVDEWVLTANGSYVWNDIDGDGYFDRGNEDLNGDNILNEYGVDMYADYNSNGYVDAAEIGPAPREYYERMGDKDPESTWLSWSDIPYQGQKDYDGFYTYGAGTTWDRTSWYLDESHVYGLKFDLESQVTLNHSIRTGIDAGYQNVYRYDATDRYGYGENFRVKPTNFAAYIQDKMEFGSMIMNVG